MTNFPQSHSASIRSITSASLVALLAGTVFAQSQTGLALGVPVPSPNAQSQGQGTRSNTRFDNMLRYATDQQADTLEKQWRNAARGIDKLLSALTVKTGKHEFTVFSYKSGSIRIQTAEGKTLANLHPKQPMNWSDTQSPLVLRVDRQAPPRKQASLGLSVTGVPAALASYIDEDLSEKVLVVNVRKGSAAAAAGIRKHDILLKVDGKSSLSSKKLSVMIAQKRPGQTIDVSILRRGSRKTLQVKLGSITMPNRFLQLGYPWPTTGSGQFRALTYPKSGFSQLTTPSFGYLTGQQVGKKGNTVDKKIQTLLDQLDAQRKRIDATLNAIKKLEKKQNERQRRGR